MTKLRLCLASVLLASSLSTACSTATAASKVAAPSQLEPVRKVDRAALRAKLAQRRAISVKNFLAYRDAKIYPQTTGRDFGFAHVWFDGENLCAAATLISKDWGRDAAIRAGSPNDITLAGVTSGPLADWILTSGLTHHEIVAIQVPGFNEREMSRELEVNRLYTIYIDVERQLAALGNESLDAATDALMKRPDLARIVLDGRVAGAGTFAKPPVG